MIARILDFGKAGTFDYGQPEASSTFGRDRRSGAYSVQQIKNAVDLWIGEQLNVAGGKVLAP